MGAAAEPQGPEPKKRKRAVKPIIEEVADTEGEEDAAESPESEAPMEEDEDEEEENKKEEGGEDSHSSLSPSY